MSILSQAPSAQEMTGLVDQKPPSRSKKSGKGRHSKAAQFLHVNEHFSTDPNAPTLAHLQREVAPLLVQLFKAMAAQQEVC